MAFARITVVGHQFLPLVYPDQEIIKRGLLAHCCGRNLTVTNYSPNRIDIRRWCPERERWVDSHLPISVTTALRSRDVLIIDEEEYQYQPERVA